MSERRYREVRSRSRCALFPPSMDDYVFGDNPVRAINACVDTLDPEPLGFGDSGMRKRTAAPVNRLALRVCR